MNPRSMSEWIFPAARRASVPARMVQARTSGPATVKKEISSCSWYAARMKRSRAGSASPMSRRNSCWSPGSSSAISASRLAESVRPAAPIGASDASTSSGSAFPASSSSRFSTASSGVSVSSE